MKSVFTPKFKEPCDHNYSVFLHLSGDDTFMWSYFSMRFLFKVT